MENNYIVENGVAIVTVEYKQDKEYEVRIDEDILPYLNSLDYHTYVITMTKGKPYVTSTYKGNTVQLQRVVCKLTRDDRSKLVHFIDGDTLNCTSANLQVYKAGSKLLTLEDINK